MTRRHVPDSTKEEIVRLGPTHTRAQIAEKLGVSLPTVKRTFRNVRETGKVSRPSPNPGRKRILKDDALELMRAYVEAQPGARIKDVQAELKDGYDIVVSHATVSRALAGVRCAGCKIPPGRGKHSASCKRASRGQDEDSVVKLKQEEEE